MDLVERGAQIALPNRAGVTAADLAPPGVLARLQDQMLAECWAGFRQSTEGISGAAGPAGGALPPVPLFPGSSGTATPGTAGGALGAGTPSGCGPAFGVANNTSALNPGGICADPPSTGAASLREEKVRNEKE